MAVYLRRNVEKYLKNWKTKEDRKPLIIRGARQVGKSTMIDHFGSGFDQYLKLNLEEVRHRKLFLELDDINRLVDRIWLEYRIPEKPGQVLLFLDEIQECPKAIAKLRYFYEERPDIHVIAAGSLLSFALKDVKSFPVGRVEHLVLHPFDFREFLLARGNERAIEAYHKIPVSKVAHFHLLDEFHMYTLIGGMPEIVNKYIRTGGIAGLAPIYRSLWQSYRDDVEKYARNPTDRKIIRHILETAPYANDRITLAGFGHSNYRSREVREAMQALQQARVLHLLYPTSQVQPPLFPNFRRKPKLMMIDTGLMNYAAGIQADLIGIEDLNDLFRGQVIQHLVGQQLMARSLDPSFRPAFWVREKTNATAEVDYCIQHRQNIIPVEVKSGKAGKLRSLHQFMERTNHSLAVRLLANYINIEKVKTQNKREFTLASLPYYLAGQLDKYIDWIKSELS